MADTIPLGPDVEILSSWAMRDPVYWVPCGGSSLLLGVAPLPPCPSVPPTRDRGNAPCCLTTPLVLPLSSFYNRRWSPPPVGGSPYVLWARNPPSLYKRGRSSDVIAAPGTEMNLPTSHINRAQGLEEKWGLANCNCALSFSSCLSYWDNISQHHPRPQ
jgi:hypothetical protein